MDPEARHAAFEISTGRNEDPAAPGNTAVDLAVDLAGERPSTSLHGLRPDRASRWIGGAIVGVLLTTFAIMAAVGGDDDAPVEREVPLLEPQLEAPLSFAVISLERVRLEWMTTEILRTMDRPIAQASKRAPKTPVHASTGTAPTNASSRKPAPKLSDLPPPVVDAPVEPKPDAPAADAPPADPPADADAPPAALPSVDAPEPEVVDDEV
jgi:hypothetical protein